MAVGWYCHTANANCKAEFRRAIAKTVPSLVKLLEHRDEDVRWEAVELISKLVNRGECNSGS